MLLHVRDGTTVAGWCGAKVFRNKGQTMRMLVPFAAVRTCTALIAVLLSASLLASADATRNGRIDIRDVQWIVNRQLGLIQPPSDYPLCGDANGDSQIDASDVQLTVNIIVGSPLPVISPSPTALPIGIVGQFYEHWLPSAGGTAPYAWTYQGSLPAGFSFGSDGKLIGVPTVDGNYTVTVSVRDSVGAVQHRSHSLWIRQQNLTPVALPDSYTAFTNATLSVPAPGVMANDYDPNNDPITVSVLSLPTYGTLLLNLDGSFTYHTTAPPNTSDAFTYLLQDDRGALATGSVSITIDTPRPVANDDDYTTAPDTSLLVGSNGVLANDLDPSNTYLTALLVSAPLNGSIQFASGGNFTYTPAPGFIGEDEFVYRATDAFGNFDDAFVRVLVSEPLLPGEFVATALANPEPPLAGAPADITVRVWDALNLLPATNNVTSVTVDLPSYTAPIALTPTGHTSSQVGVWQGSVPTTGFAFGMHVLTVTVTNAQSTTSQLPVSLMVRTAAILRVGPGRNPDNVAGGLAQCPPGGAVVIDAGLYSGPGNTGLVAPDTIIICGELGVHYTTLSGVITGPIVEQTGPGTPHFSGLTFANSSVSALRLTSSAVLHRVRVRNNTNLDNGAGVQATSGNLTVRECWIRDNQVVNNNNNTSRYGGGVHLASGVTGTFDHTLFRANRAAAMFEGGGGGLMVDVAVLTGTTSPAHLITVTDCLFSENQSASPANANGGGLYIKHNRPIDILRTKFVANRALGGGLSGMSSENPNQSTSGIARGGAIAAYTRCHLRLTNCLLHDNAAMAGNTSTGGAAFITSHCAVTMHRITLTENFVSNGGTGTGGAIDIGSVSTLRTELCLFQDNFAEARFAPRGGAIHANAYSLLDHFLTQFIGNEAYGGGSHWIQSSSWLVTDQCLFQHNRADALRGLVNPSPSGLMGGAIVGSLTVSFLVEHTQFIDNDVTSSQSSAGWGGAVAIDTGTATQHPAGIFDVQFANCLFRDNSAGAAGGAFARLNSGVQQITRFINCSFSANSTNGTGGAMDGGTPSFTMINCISWGNLAGTASTSEVNGNGIATNCCISPGGAPSWAYATSLGNFSANPQWLSGSQGDFYLSLASPCVDAGSTSMYGLSLSSLTTRTDELPDTGAPDVGWHYVPLSLPMGPLGTATAQAWVAANAMYVGTANVPPPAAPPALQP